MPEERKRLGYLGIKMNRYDKNKEGCDMTFINPNINSSYRQKEMGRFLYYAVVESNAKKIVDIGILNGYSTVCLALAAKKTGGMVCAYDLFEDYNYTNSNYDVVVENLEKYSVLEYVKLEKKSFDDWVQENPVFDVLHVDISNTGNVVEKLYINFKVALELGARIFFEGGSEKRDFQDWMVEHNMKKINDTNVPFKVLIEDSYYDETNGRTYYPCISELMR